LTKEWINTTPFIAGLPFTRLNSQIFKTISQQKNLGDIFETGLP
jgi:hypothetical protein